MLAPSRRFANAMIQLREMFQHTGLVIVAAGRGTRFGGFKQLATVGGMPLLKRTMSAFDDLPFAERVVVLPGELMGDEGLHADLAGGAHVWRFVEGGDLRAQSVLRGVRALGRGVELAAVHDGARPFPPIEATWRCVALLGERPVAAGAIVVARVHDTLKRVDPHGAVVETVTRSELVRAETPQVARRGLLVEALGARGAEEATDEAQALERAGHLVATIPHEGLNPKVTTRQDILLAEAILAQRPNLMKAEIETR